MTSYHREKFSGCPSKFFIHVYAIFDAWMKKIFKLKPELEKKNRVGSYRKDSRGFSRNHLVDNIFARNNTNNVWRKEGNRRKEGEEGKKREIGEKRERRELEERGRRSKKREILGKRERRECNKGSIVKIKIGKKFKKIKPEFRINFRYWIVIFRVKMLILE